MSRARGRRVVAVALAAALALVLAAACGMSVGDEQSTLGGQGLSPLYLTPTATTTTSPSAP